MKRIFKVIIILITSILLISVILFFVFILILKDDWYTVEKYGNNYQLEIINQETYNIVYRIKNKSHYVVKENIIEYNFDNRWIIAKSKKYNYPLELTKTDNGYVYSKTIQPDSVIVNYWIIDKSISINLSDSNTFEKIRQGNYHYLIVKSGLTGPLDSLNFYNIQKERDIDLTLKPHARRSVYATSNQNQASSLVKNEQ